METRKYKTDIHCNECVIKVTRYINNVYGVNSWEVDTNSKDNVLTVNGYFKEDELKNAIKESGFTIKEEV